MDSPILLSHPAAPPELTELLHAKIKVSAFLQEFYVCFLKGKYLKTSISHPTKMT